MAVLGAPSPHPGGPVYRDDDWRTDVEPRRLRMGKRGKSQDGKGDKGGSGKGQPESKQKQGDGMFPPLHKTGRHGKDDKGKGGRK